MKRWNWPLILFFVLLVVLTSIGILTAAEKTICASSQLEKSASQANTVVFFCWEFWLNRYQTLLAAVIALAAAGGSIYFLRQQIGQAERHESERYAREGAAARALLPLSLSEITEYSTAAGAAIDRIWPTHRFIDVQKNLKTSIPAPPIEAAKQLENAIKTMTVVEGAALSKIIARIQILNARTRGTRIGQIVGQHNLIQYALDAVEINARCAENFKYARGEGNPETALTRKSMETACKVMSLHQMETDLLAAIADNPARFP